MKINLKKILLAYSLGFSVAFFMPQSYYFGIMTACYQKLNTDLIVIEKEDYYKLI